MNEKEMERLIREGNETYEALHGKGSDNPNFNPEALRMPALELKEMLEGEWTEEVSGQLLSTIGFNVFTFDKVEDGSTLSYAIPYENIALARSAHRRSLRIVEVYFIHTTVRSMARLEGDDADRFWKWYTK